MKKNYETPVVEKIEFDYVETVRANSNGYAGGCGNGNTSGQQYFTNRIGQQVYQDSNPGYDCMNTLAPNWDPCGYNGKHTSNPGYICGVGKFF